MSYQDSAQKPKDKLTAHAGQKRKDAPTNLGGSSTKRPKPGNDKKLQQQQQQPKKAGNSPAGAHGKHAQTAKQKRQQSTRDARTLVTQTTSKAFKNGELDVDRFVKAREFEIRALQEGLERSKLGRNRRAFQQVPKDMRRRAGAWDVKKLPKHRRGRAAREIAEDNTPTGKARRKKLTRNLRLRLETVKKLRALGARGKAAKAKAKEEKVEKARSTGTVVATRDAKVKKNTLRQPGPVKAKFRKRQIHKTWLPTHMFHAKRAHMSPAMEPVWRFAMPLTPTLKSYRPTHRAATERGAIAWDVSYMATISLDGVEASLLGLLKGLHAELPSGQHARLWKNGVRSWHGWLFMREDRTRAICPATVIWRAEPDSTSAMLARDTLAKPVKRSIFVRAHPSAFHQLWEEVIRLCKVQKPQVAAEDRRYDIGSIEVAGPGSTEALQAVLWPSQDSDGQIMDDVGRSWQSLRGLDTPASLPPNATLAFKISDPRLHHPPRTVELPSDQQTVLKGIFALDTRDQTAPQAIFDSVARRGAIAAMQSQKAINRRKGQSTPGEYPTPQSTDPSIPVLLFASSIGSTVVNNSARKSKAISWTVLLPWKAVLPVWHSLMYYPLSTGGQPRFGGLEQHRQLAFENGQPWWPGDFAGTKAGNEWIERETDSRKKAWERRPRSRRVAFETLDLGAEKKGELGEGWAMPFGLLLADEPADEEPANDTTQPSENIEKEMQHISSAQALALLHAPKDLSNNTISTGLFTVRITFLGRGTPKPCARIYTLPSTPDDKQKWTALLPAQYLPPGARPQPRRRDKSNLPTSRGKEVDIAALAKELLSGPPEEDENCPACPGKEDLIGFVTSGAFNLREGKGTAVGSLGVSKVRSYWSREAGNLKGEKMRKVCVVRNAGERVGRLAIWELA
ncbi:hypothetical protein K461DRAFT_315478 [Myriangium duriaei CBS 260.36]|uniref:POPLD-domain-containing protein n=1 Tax=Myriangium duriaei CBS 260.36 TaxID=1168546 RepID=A0A9P4IZ30_9PEZI|nr:hypothetical protein K461DRAFT_315478 [Myriangium duriaei CBS 260.36]